jgi:ketosteroid isomerase-like protein
MRLDYLRIFLSIKLAVALILAASLVDQRLIAQSTDTDEEQIRAVLAKYATSVDNADVALASTIWSQDPGVSFIHPLGTEHGFQQIADHVYVGIMGGMFSRRELIMHNPVVHIYGDSAWSEMTWTFHALEKNGTAITTERRETQVYHKENGGWRIVLVHYSGPPAAMPQQAPGF